MSKSYFFIIGLSLCISCAQDKVENSALFVEPSADQLTDILGGVSDGKLFFIDVYTDWCLPCKKMDFITFKDSTVMEMLNRDFISIKINPERSNDLRDFANLKKINAYPTFLVMEPGGNEVTRILGFLDPVELENTLQPITSYYRDPDTKRLEQRWKNKDISYDDHRRLAMMVHDIRTAKAKDMFDSYTDRLRLDSYGYDHELMNIIGATLNHRNADQIEYLRAHVAQKIWELNSAAMQDNYFTLRMNLFNFYNEKIDSSIANNDWATLETMQANMVNMYPEEERVDEEMKQLFDEQKMQFYYQNEPDDFFKAALLYVNEHVLSMSIDDARALDEKFRTRSFDTDEEYKKYGLEVEKDSMTDVRIEHFYASNQGEELFDIAKKMLELYPNDQANLSYAASLANLAYDYFQYPAYYRLHARILRAMGQDEEAINVLRKAKDESYLYNDAERDTLSKFLSILMDAS